MIRPQNIIASIDKNVKKKQWDCLRDDCNEVAINSHLVQRNGLLSNIAVDGHLIELKMVDAYKWDKKRLPIEFRRVGIKHALAYKVFCNRHDTEVFRNIEGGNTDFESYESFLLFSYRAVCAEISKKRFVVEKYKRVVNSNILNGKVDKETIKLAVEGNETGIQNLRVIKQELESEIETNGGRFTFYFFKYPKVFVYASAVFSATDIDFQRKDDAQDLENIYIHILPLVNETLILVGYHNDHTSSDTIEYCKSWEKLSEEELNFKLTGLFSSNIENWGISPDLFKTLKQKNITKYINLIKKNVSYFGISRESDFNLFEVN